MSNDPQLNQNTAFNELLVQTRTTEINGIFTYDVPNKKFQISEKIGGTVFHYENTSSALYASAASSELNIRAGSTSGDITVVRTRTHPRFHADRGKVFADSMFVDSWSVKGAEIEFGMFDIDEDTLEITNGMTFLYTNKQIYFKVYSNGTQTNVGDDGPLDPGVLTDFQLDPTKGHLCDIQAQWRGVGDIRWFLSSLKTRAPKNAWIFKALNQMDNLTMANPSIHAGYVARNNGGVPHARSGCFDLSTESFDKDVFEPEAFSNNADVTAAAAGTVLYAMYVPYTFNGIVLTRDSLLRFIKTSAVARSRYKIWRLSGYTRLTKGATVPLVDGDWDTRTDGSANWFIDNSVAGLITGFDKTGLTPIDGDVVPANGSTLSDFRDDHAPTYITHGDIIVVEGYANNADMSTVIKLGEEM